MAKISKSSTKKTNTLKKKLSPVGKKTKIPTRISKVYVPKDSEKYMCEKHKVFFRMKLQEWRKELVKANNPTKKQSVNFISLLV